MLNIRTVLFFLILFILTNIVNGQEFNETRLDEYMVKAMELAEVPGASITIVKGEEVLLTKGYGTRTLGKNQPVNADTLFAIGSLTKAFTATALGILVQEGKISWDDKLVDLLPYFRTKDPYVNTNATIRDALAHRTGVASVDESSFSSPELSREQLMVKLSKMPQEKSFRASNLYNNYMYLAAGQVIPAITGLSWDEFITGRIFKPLKMLDSNTTIRDLKGQNNVATPHQERRGKVKTAPYYSVDSIAPAGSINSTANDMAKWCRLQINSGKYAGKQIVDEAIINETRAAHNLPHKVFPKSKFLGIHHRATGLGWGRLDYRGGPVVNTHTGRVDGMEAVMAVIPEEELCVVVLNNKVSNANLHIHAVTLIIDQLLDYPATDLLKILNDGIQAEKKKQQQQEKEFLEQRTIDSKPSHSLAAYVGDYHNELLGNITITNNSGKLEFKWGSLYSGELNHWHFDTFRTSSKNPYIDEVFISFSLGFDGAVTNLIVDANYIGEGGSFQKTVL